MTRKVRPPRRSHHKLATPEDIERQRQWLGWYREKVAEQLEKGEYDHGSKEVRRPARKR